MESRRKRVEQKGRFTITEILPGSPYSPRLSPSFQGDEMLLADIPAPSAPTSNGSCNDAASIQPTPQQHTLVVNEMLEIPVSNGALEPSMKMEDPPQTHTQPPEAVTTPVTSVEVDLAVIAATEVPAMETASEVSTPKAASIPVAMDSPSRKLLSPKKSRESAQRTPKPSARRIKRKGRFTIIELASDSPTSVKNADDVSYTSTSLFDHSSNNCDEETWELYMQVDTLTRSNETLQSLLNSAEREARHRSLEIECLSEENDELRHRYGQLEARYIDERKQSFMLEEELQRIRMLSLTPPEQQLRQQQEQHQQLSTQTVAVE
ncbi:hypothetical protein BBO99_00003419 [Phytophthora kernoviae]|uniref:Uncharacterized protein n=2 Tax=Phytophthora kernoviae TaxID=325452 RepID=A0A3R7GMQ6_9STRA|nr:hypothetical protein G195_003875 [Phytophthora kernoviae 00238/432]KAG2526695.1 hypothetical protein JM16_003751 [Phytophthora kernoviae]KAG2529342.1 hypothetical protein JM18_002843 [Phytophthora kernoviae]RLN20686.1 hypothetical protein BBI17_003447 [Phytophthora kernoviae]RLN81783.1 hypothetical protein BBO99_00003419 [Phytophthora kernoviae]